MNTKSRWVPVRAWKDACCITAALGWILGGASPLLATEPDSWGRKPGSWDENLGSVGSGWVTSLSARVDRGPGRAVLGLSDGSVGLQAGLSGTPGTLGGSLRREWATLGHAGRVGETRSALLEMFDALAGEVGIVEVAASASASVTLDLGLDGPTVLSSGTAGQSVPLWLRNDGTALDLGGLDLKIGITGGTLPAPAITGVNLRAGNLFTTANSVQGGDAANTPQTQFWSVSVNDPLAPAVLAGGGTLTRIGTLTLSTLGVPAGQWSLSLSANETALLGPFGDTVEMTLVGGTLTVVPEIGWTPVLSGVGLTAWAIARRRSSGACPGVSRVQGGTRPEARA